MAWAMETTEAPHGEAMESRPQRRSRWWYAAPLLLAIVGGVVAYLALRGDDPRLARNCLVVGGATTAACVAMQAGLLTGAFLP